MRSRTRADVHRETDRGLRRLHLGIGEELTRIRLDANVSIAALSRATGVDDAYIGRIEAGVASPSIEVLIALGVALGADFNARYFPGIGPRIHDRFQAPMVEALLGSLSPQVASRAGGSDLSAVARCHRRRSSRHDVAGCDRSDDVFLGGIHVVFDGVGCG